MSFTVPVAQGSQDHSLLRPHELEDSQEEKKRLKRERKDNEPFLFRNKLTTRVKQYSITLPPTTIYRPKQTNATKRRRRKKKKKK